MIYPFILSIFLLAGCASSNQKAIESNFFDDINIYSLKGLNNVAHDSYPNIEIVDSGNCRVLKYHISDSNFLQRTYAKDGDNWVLNFFEKDDTTNIYTTRIIYPGGLVEFSYTDSSHSKIYDVGVLIKDTMLYYRPQIAYNRKLNLEDLKTVLKHSSLKVKFWADTTNKSIRINKLIYDQIEQSGTSIITCYPKNNQSFFWWYETQYYQSSTKCN